MSSADVGQRAAAVQWRRALTLLGLTALAPGSAQVAAGNRRLGLFALRVWVGVLVALAGLVVVGLIRRGLLVTLVTTAWTLWVVLLLVVALGLGWVALILDTWRLGRPGALRPGRRLVFGVLCAGLATSVGAASGWGALAVVSEIELVGKVFQGGGTVEAAKGRFNILLLGGDAGTGREGLRPDSITVASVDARTGRTVLIGLPRNLEDVPFPASSPLHGLFPNGYGCKDHSCLLNAIYTLGMDHADLYGGSHMAGVRATREAVEEITGLDINYFAMIDLAGFAALVNAVGGIDVDVNRAVPIGGETSPISGYIGPGKNIHLNGNKALWFARSRAGSTDYDRMQRQKCVMNAMLNQLDPLTVATRFTALMGATGKIVETDVPSPEIGNLVELALKARKLPIASLSLTPPLIHPGAPDWGLIRRLVTQKIGQSEALDAPGATPTPTATGPVTVVTAAPAPTRAKGQKTFATISAPTEAQTPQNEVGDLGEVCAAR